MQSMKDEVGDIGQNTLSGSKYSQVRRWVGLWRGNGSKFVLLASQLASIRILMFAQALPEKIMEHILLQ